MGEGRYGDPPPGAAGPAVAAKGDIADLEQFRERLRLFAARRLGNPSEAEDVVQEVLRRAFEALRAGSIREPAALPAFLFQTARHVCMHRGRSAGREKKALQRFGSPTGDEGNGTESPLMALISEERRLGVRQALGQLDPDERKLLEMTYRDELDSVEIGRQLGLTAGTVRVRRHRAIRRLAELLGVTKPADRELKE
jgi:RNA polymerase sigma-70 factor (ECF subfamily)